MEKKQEIRLPISAPNLINICVDRSDNGELSGRIYHCCDCEPEEFSNVVQLLNRMEQFFDRVLFPQASTQPRSLAASKKTVSLKHRAEKVVEADAVIRHMGEKGSFLTCVKYRQNADWQGEVTWMEKKITWSFDSTLEFLKLLDNALM